MNIEEKKRVYRLSFIVYRLSFIVYRLSFIVYRLSFIVCVCVRVSGLGFRVCVCWANVFISP